MEQTAKYCIDCLGQLSPGSATIPEDQVMLRAIEYTDGGQPNYGKAPDINMGRCTKCGNVNILVSYDLAA
jgi:hypothetical protein